MKNKFLQFLSSMRRGAAMLIMLLTLGVGQMWGDYYAIGELTAWNHTASEKMTQVGSTSTYYKVVSSKAKGDYRFRVDEGKWEKTHGWSQAITDGSDFTLTNASDGDNSMCINLPSATSYLTIWFDSDDNKVWVTNGNYATQTIYVIGSNSWTDNTVKAHVFTGTAAYYAWGSDQTMTKTSTISRAGITYKVYSYAFPKGYKSAIFRYGESQTADLTWNASTPYYSVETSDWYATTADALAKYLVGTNWTSASWDHRADANKMTDNEDGSYSKDVSITDATKLISLKVSKKGTWTNAWGGAAKGTGYNLSQDFGTDGDGNLTFKVTHSGTTKITLTSAGKINVGAPYQVSYAAGTGASGSVDASAVTIYGSTCTLSSSTFSKTGYTQDGWATSEGGSKAYNLGASYTGGYTDVTLYPHWAENTFDVTVNDDGHGSTSPSGKQSSVGQITGIAISANHDDDYEFVNWTIESGTGSFEDATDESTTFYPTSAVTIQANFRSTATNSLTVAAGTHVGTVTGSTDPVTLGNSYAISASNFDPGYEFYNWTASPVANATFVNASSASTNVTVKNGSVTVTANARERMSSLTTSNYYDAGNPSYAIPTKTNSSIGISTTATITATTPSTGYTFAGWTLSDNIVVTSGNKDTDLSIIVSTNGNGAEATAQAKYNEVLTSTYYLVGNNLAVFPGDKTWTASDSKNMLRKASGSSTGNVGSITIDVKTIPATNSDYQFKIHKSTGNKWYGWSNDKYYWMDATKTTSLYDNQHNLYFIPNALGDYTFSVNWGVSDPSLTVTFPATTYTVNFGQGTGTAGSATATYSSTSFSSGTKVQNGKSITLSAPAAISGKYNWDGWYNASSGGSKVSSSNPFTTTVSSSNHNFYARYTEITHTVTLSNGGHGHVEIGGATVTSVSRVGSATASGTITAVPDPGYYFTGWTGDINNGVTIASGTASSASITINATADSKNITANFAPIWRLVGSMNSWNDGTNPLLNYSTEGGKNYVYVEVSLNANTQYSFKVKDVQTSKMYKPTSSNTEITYANKATAQGMNNTADGDPNQTIMTAAAGTYRFTWNITDKSIKVTYPASCKVTFGKGTGGLTITASGSTTGSISSGNYVASGENVTFTETHTTPGYTFAGWYTAASGGSAVPTMAVNDNTLNSIASDATVYSRYTENMTTVNLSASPAGKGTFTCGGDAVTSVSAGVATKPQVTAVPATGYRVNTSATVWTKDNNYVTLSSTTANPVTITGTGTTGNTTALTATFTPKTYTITLNQNGATTESDPTSLSATYDAKAPVYVSDIDNYKYDITNPERTGYTFGGWWTEGITTQVITTTGFYDWDATDYIYNSGCWKYDGDVTLYAKWTPNPYAVTLSTTGETGYGSNAPANQTATYGAAMPTITPPVGAPGYKFQGYFTAANGSGTKYYNADGTSAHAWDIASATTLHAHFQKTVISTLEHPASIASGDVVTLDVNPVLNQTGATNYMDICWSLLYDNDNPVESGVAVAANPVDGKPNQVRFTLTGLSAGYYKVKAVLKANASSFEACDAGTELSTLKSNVRIAGNSNVTILYQDASGNTIRENGAVEVARGETVEVTAPEIIGYSFATWVLGDVLATDDALTDNPITISAEYDGILIAKYNRKNTIYFKNTLNWPAVYVNLLNEGYWNENGSGNNGHSNRNLEMTRLGESDIWYYEYDGKTATAYVSFTSVVQNGSGSGADNFWGADTAPEESKVRVVYPTRPNYDNYERTAYGFNVNTPMFVPLAGQTAKEMNKYSNGSAFYYNQGYWAKYEPVSKETGYTLKIYNKKNSAATPDAGQAPVLMKSVPFTFNGDMTLPVSVTVDLEAGKWYGFKIYRDKGNTGDALSWYGNGGDMSNKHSGDFDKGEAVWEFKSTQASNCGLQTTSAGDYVFTLAYGKELSTDSMQYLVGVHYPEAAGDYRLVYSDDNRTGILSTTIPYNSEADTLSFFVDVDADPSLALQKCAVSYDGGSTTTVTWTDTIADLFSGGLPAAISESGVYYFCINRNTSGKKELGDVKLYTGNFYIRTDGATPSKWDNFRQNNHLMAYSDYAAEHENFTHSYTQWYDLTNRKNLKFTVANDYSVSISDTLTREALSGQWTNIDDYIDEKGDLNRQANVRFMYNEKTNAISRAYIDGAYADGGNFLKILARTQDSIYAAAEGGDPLTEITFTDNGNWLYEQTVFAQPGARYKLRSLFGETGGGKEIITQYFKGGAGSTAADSATMIGGDGSSRMQIRLLYDFKTNRVVTAYQPSGTIDEDLAIRADIMFMREHQEDIEQITFASGKSISEIENIYCGLRFNKWTLNNKSKEAGHATLSPLLSRYERDIFYVSFPYDVRLSDVIGFGTYGQHWIVEYYDGAARAKNGFWADSESYWKFVTPSMKDTFELKAGTGYIVALDLDELYYISEEVHASIWNNTDISDLELLFPGNVSSISNVDVTYNMPSHECKINRGTASGNRTIKDSHWNVLGVPTFKNITGEASGEPDEGVGSGEIVFANKAWVKDSLKMKFIYDGNLSDNSLTAKAVKDFEFKAMHAYVVQYCGNVTFTTSATPAPASVAARTYAEEPIDVDFRLELNKDGVLEDQTFVSMTNNEDASADFVFGEDLSKEFNNSRANIYTFIGTEWAAGNTLPMSDQTTVVPVGIKIASTGDYTFAIPDGTNGVGVTLIDNETGIRTSLSALDYTINLPAGTYDNRFVLEISPVHQSPTGIELLNGENGENGVRKVLIDNILYIVKDGVMYDAQGKRLQ